jgi:NAD(P)-dependent dehydrogenase (short-subunit alcohol dehydrogenase family)
MATKNKIALITGGSRGLGKNAAISLGEKGIDVILTYVSKEAEAKEVVEQLKSSGVNAATLRLDVSDISTFDSFSTELSAILKEQFDVERFDFLVNNAGTGATIPFMNVTEENFDTLLNVHFKGVFFLTQKLVGLMNDGGSIINLSSGTTRMCNPGYIVYASMKGGVEVMTRYMAKELGPRKIRVNIVAPGAIETDFNNAIIRNNPEIKNRIASNTALGRVGEPDDIGGIIAFLCTPDAGWINGQRIEVSGGVWL